jgi:GAF domain-containing protein/HAMP domain-containing protein
MSNQSLRFSERKPDERKSSRLVQLATGIGQLTYPQKFVLITLIFALPLIAFLPLVFEQSTYIDRYGHKEAQGTIYLRGLWQLTNNLQTLQYASGEYSEGMGSFTAVEEARADTEADFQALETIHQQYGGSLALDFDINELKVQWQDLKTNLQDSPRAENVADLISSIGQLTKEVGDTSYLILDPDLDTYYMMDTVLLKMPENQALLFQILLITDEAIDNQASTPEREAQLVVLIGRLESNLNILDRNIQTALQNNPSGTFQPLVDASRQNYINSSLSFANLIKTNLLGDQLTQVNAETLDSSYFEARQAADAFYESASQALEIGIHTRITNLSARLYTVATIAILSVLVAFVIGLLTMRAISGPLVQLISATKRLAAGEMTARVPIARNDEVGQVAYSFNLMAQELQVDRSAVEGRTRDLEIAQQQSERRATQLQTIAELSETIAQLQDLSEIFPTATSLISERFGFYHVGIFLVDQNRDYAILQAANSEGGKRMLERRHRLRLGTGVVGFAAQAGQPRIALDVGSDAVFFDNPDLPNTRSEVALPLKVRGETIGVLDVQSTEAGAFTNEDLQVLTALANQVSIALENARLLTETRAALAQVQEVYNEYTRAEWSRTVANIEQPGFRYRTGRIEMMESAIQSPEVSAAVEQGEIMADHPNGSEERRPAVAIPVKLRGEVIGVLHIESNDASREWEKDEVGLVAAVAERAAVAMENARLFQDARRRAAKEHSISEATARIGSALNIENILHVTAEELERVLGGSEIVIQLESEKQQAAEPPKAH